MINGVINIYKERGFTSHDVVAKLRGILSQKKIGHTGTLDPDAVGVLPVCLGSATRLCDMLTDTDKVYEAVLLLGMRTDTQDTSGTMLEECAVRVAENADKGAEKIVIEESQGECVKEVTKDVIKAVISGFIGDYDQIPPMYSAVKVNGKKLYELAREGKVIERKARHVQIYDIVIESIEEVTSDMLSEITDNTMIPIIPVKDVPECFPKMAVKMTVSCSKGTYVRTLCEDIGAKLGMGGCMWSLKRTKSGIFTVKDSLTLSEAETHVKNGTFDEVLVPVDAMFSNLAKVRVNELGERLLKNGNPLPIQAVCGFDGSSVSQNVRIYDISGKFTAIYAYAMENREFKVVKMFL